MVRLLTAWMLTALLAAARQASDALPEGAVAMLGSARLRPAGTTVAFTPDSRFLGMSHEGHVSIFDLRDGRVVRQWRSNHLSAAGVAFTPDDRYFVAGAGATAFPYADHAPGLWDWRTGRLLRRFHVPARGEGTELGELALSADGTQLALRHITRENNRITASSFSLRDLKDDRVRHSWPGSTLAFAPDGSLAAIGAERLIRLVDRRTGQTVRILGPTGKARRLAFMPDGKILVALAPDLEFWDVVTGKRRAGWLPVDGYAGHREFCVACRHPWIATRDTGGTIHVWDVAARTRIAQFDTLCGLVAFSPDDRTLVLRQELQLRLWDTVTWRERCHFEGHSTWVQHAVYSPDGRRVATSAGPQVLLWEAATGKLLQTKSFGEDYPGNIGRIHWSPDSRMVLTEDRRYRLWDADTGYDLALPPSKLAPGVYFFHPRDGHLLALVASAKGKREVDLVTWDPRAARELRRRPLGNMQPVGQSPSGLLLVLEEGYRSYRLWDGKELRALKLPNTRWRFAGVDDRQVAFSDGSTLGLWDGCTGQERWRSNRIYKDGPARYQFSPEGSYLYVGGWSAPQVLRTADGQVVRSYRLPAGQWVSDGRLSPDGRVLVLLVSRSKDMVEQHFVSIETASGQVRRRFAVPPDGPPWLVRLAAVAPDSQTFLSVGPGLSAVVWDLAGLGEARRRGVPGPAELEAFWQDLAGADAGNASHALARLVTAGRVGQDFLARKLRPAGSIEPARLARLIGQLVDDNPALRVQAREALRALDRQAVPALRQALQARPPAELRGPLEELLNASDGFLGPGVLLQQVRAVEALEHLGAIAVLRELARGDPGQRLTQECQAALKRRQR
jgi:WD40 repeat protein